MVVIGHGIDLTETARIAEMVRKHGERFLERCFTEAERAYAAGSTKREHEHLAARFAAKEAVLKALGTGWRDGIAWTDIEIVREPSGRPMVKLSGMAATVAAGLGIRAWHVSLSHTHTHAMASAIACG
ncbi:MAG: holo-[acyl-carrier-protein] synthase [Planctomycetes bacterium]|nr:holo-[acyl-carrier-protein] synthase [Planctomycetota bacterium]